MGRNIDSVLSIFHFVDLSKIRFYNMDPQINHADTVPGFTMQSEGFYLKFVTGLQCGVSSKLLEYETDWYEVMEIILSRLQDEPESKERFEIIASRDLEYWARVQPGGEALNLKIRVVLERPD